MRYRMSQVVIFAVTALEFILYILMSNLYFVLRSVFHRYPVHVLLLWSAQYFLFTSQMVSVFLFHCFSFYHLFWIDFFCLEFANNVTYAWFRVQDPATIIICCMFSSACEPVPNHQTFWKCWHFVSVIACRFYFIINRLSKFKVSFKNLHQYPGLSIPIKYQSK